MPNHYKGLGLTPQICYDSPIVPYTGATPPDGPMASQADASMVTPSDPTQFCGPICPSSCCGANGDGSDGGQAGDGNGGGALPRSVPA